ncbi:MAG: ribosome small subunit-dependent GTPase A [Anaerolineae bacterium]|nr:ribosome small subunit-dependent GTPase A [Anaerolineae bacterium]
MANNPEAYHKGMAKEERRRKLQKASKTVRRQQNNRSPRQRDWLEYTDDDAIDEIESFERIMPRDESDRRRAVEQKIAVPTGEPIEPVDVSIDDSLTGRVVEVSSGLYRVDLGGEIVLCQRRGSLGSEESGYTNLIAVGDAVTLTLDGSDGGVIEQVHPRRSLIARQAGAFQQIVAANVDQLLIIASWRNPNLWPELVDRYLVVARRYEVEPVLVVNKIDLAGSMDEIEETVAGWREVGLRIVLTSAEDGSGIDDLSEAVTGKTSVLAGLSGVGKSSLLRAINPAFDLRTGEVNTEKGQGRHTTTQSLMLALDDDTYVIDTPGIREFGLAGIGQKDLARFYPEFDAAAAACRFADCAHVHEPDCAVRAAVEAGTINDLRYQTYLKILDSLPE